MILRSPLVDNNCLVGKGLTVKGKCDVIGKFSANGTTKVKICFAPRCQWARGNLPLGSVDVIKWHLGKLHQ